MHSSWYAKQYAERKQSQASPWLKSNCGITHPLLIRVLSGGAMIDNEMVSVRVRVHLQAPAATHVLDAVTIDVVPLLVAAKTMAAPQLYRAEGR